MTTDRILSFMISIMVVLLTLMWQGLTPSPKTFCLNLQRKSARLLPRGKMRKEKYESEWPYTIDPSKQSINANGKRNGTELYTHWHKRLSVDLQKANSEVIRWKMRWLAQRLQTDAELSRRSSVVCSLDAVQNYRHVFRCTTSLYEGGWVTGCFVMKMLTWHFN